MKIRIVSSEDVRWTKEVGQIEESTAIVERNEEQWQQLFHIQVIKDQTVIDEYSLSVDLRGRVSLEKKDKPPLYQR